MTSKEKNVQFLELQMKDCVPVLVIKNINTNNKTDFPKK